MLPSNEKEEILRKLFSPEGDLRFTLGRFPMNANDFSRNWYSCDEVPGDFELKHFNIDRDILLVCRISRRLSDILRT